jgi:hypothetical protein
MEQGLTGLTADALRKVLDGVTSLAEVANVAAS